MRPLTEVDFSFWRVVGQCFQPLHVSGSGRVNDDGYTGLSFELSKEEIEKESGSLDDDLAQLRDMLG